MLSRRSAPGSDNSLKNNDIDQSPERSDGTTFLSTNSATPSERTLLRIWLLQQSAQSPDIQKKENSAEFGIVSATDVGGRLAEMDL